MWEWTALLLATLGGALLARFLGRHADPLAKPNSIRADVAVSLGIGVSAWLYFGAIHATVNPSWSSVGQDNDSYLAALSALRYGPTFEVWPNNRYYLYPWLAVSWSEVSGTVLWRAAGQVSLLTSAGLVVSAYAFARVFACRPVAIAATVLLIPLQSHLEMLGTPTDYPLASALYVASVAAMVVAIRDGGTARHFLAGAMLGGFLATTPKSFPLLLLGFVAVFGAKLLRPRDGLRDLSAFLLPLLIAWFGFPLLDVQPAPLEHHMYQMQRDNGQLDLSRPFPDVGWVPEQSTPGGYWVPGTWSAIANIPRVLNYILFAPMTHTTIVSRLDGVLPEMASELGFPGMPYLVLASLVAPVAVIRSRRSRLANGLAVLAAFGFTAAHLWGITAGVYSPRYVQPVVITLPAMLLGLAALPARTVQTPWSYAAFAPMFAMVAFIVGPSSTALGMANVERWRSFSPQPEWSIAQVERLRPLVRPGDAVMQAMNSTNLMMPLLDGLGATFEDDLLVAEPGGHRLYLAASRASRRFVTFDCVIWANGEGPYTGIRPIMDAMPDRFLRISRCIYQDLRPSEPFEVFLPEVALNGGGD